MTPGDLPTGRFDARMRAALYAVAAAGVALALAATALVSLRAGLSVIVGAALSAGNLWVLAHVVASLLPVDRGGAEAQSRAGWALVAVLKMVGLLGAAWLVLRYGLASPLGLVAGFGALPIGIAIGALVSDRKLASPPGD